MPDQKINFMQIALNKWYEANQTGYTFPICSNSIESIAFDGEHVWVANPDKITKLCKNGGIAGVYSGGSGLVFDGTYMWTGQNGNFIKMQITSGKIVASYPTYLEEPWYKSTPFAFDGEYIWGINYKRPCDIIKIRAIDGSLVKVMEIIRPSDIIFDGEYIWIPNYFPAMIAKIQVKDNAISNVKGYPLESNPRALTFDGVHIWVADDNENTITKIRSSDNKIIDIYSSGGITPKSLVFDGTYIWVANSNSNNISKLRASDGSIVGVYSSNGERPVSLTFDGINIWVANAGSANVSKL